MRHRFVASIGFVALLLVACSEEKGGLLDGVVARGESPSFFAFGDWGANSQPQRQVAEAVRTVCEKEHCDFGLLLGDNFYPSGVKSVDDPMWKTHYLDIYEKLTMPFYVALGNHDHGGNVRAQMTYRDPKGRWHMPAAFYEFTVGDAAFFALDTTRWTPTQAKWLKARLEAAADVKWKVVFGHHPIFSYGASHGDTPYLVKELLPILKAAKVQLYLSGHDHDRQVLRDGAEGPLCILSGGGGAEVRDVKPGPRSLFGKSSYGAVHVSLAAGAAKLKFFDETGKVDFQLALEGDGKGVPDAGEESARASKKSRGPRRPADARPH